LGSGEIHRIKVLRGSWVAFLALVAAAAFGYGVVVAVSRLWGVDGLGVYSVGLSILTIFAALSGLGLGTASVRIIAECRAGEHDELIRIFQRRGLALTIGGGLVFGTLLFIFSEPLARLAFGASTLTVAFRVVAVGLPFLAVGLYNAEILRALSLLLASESLRLLALPAGTALLLTLVLGFGFHPSSPSTPLYATSGAAIALAIISQWLALRHIPAAPQPDGPAPASMLALHPRELLRISCPMILGSLVPLLSGRLEMLLLGMLSDLHQAGIFAAAYRLGVLASFVPGAINRAFTPHFAELFWSPEKRGRLEQTLQWSACLTFWTSVPVVVVMGAFPGFFMGLLGDEFRSGSLVLVLLLCEELLPGLASFSGSLLNVGGKQQAFQNVNVAVLILSIGLNLLAIPAFGALGTAWVMLICSLTRHGICGCLVWRWFGICPFYLPFLSNGRLRRSP
jgi:O-antigen/teichoic acid export membrane protein